MYVLLANEARSNAEKCTTTRGGDEVFCASTSTGADDKGPACPSGDAFEICERMKYADGAGYERFQHQPGTGCDSRTATIQCQNKVGRYVVIDLPVLASETDTGRVIRLKEVSVFGSATTTLTTAPAASADDGDPDAASADDAVEDSGTSRLSLEFSARGSIWLWMVFLGLW
ncbi:unnamed protein product [Amoebophrya sp. A25]|nr:unnamed protein product [Amoebophrya sp. A25]|eukprot:GSA25T00012197001.1